MKNYELTLIGFAVGYDSCYDCYYDGEGIERFLIPFRKVKTEKDLIENERKKYYDLKKEENGFYEYYVKRFDDTPKLIMLCDDSILSEDIFRRTKFNDYNNKLQFNININKYELREFFETDKKDINALNCVFLVYGEFDDKKGQYKKETLKFIKYLTLHAEKLDENSNHRIKHEFPILYK